MWAGCSGMVQNNQTLNYLIVDKSQIYLDQHKSTKLLNEVHFDSTTSIGPTFPVYLLINLESTNSVRHLHGK